MFPFLIDLYVPSHIQVITIYVVLPLFRVAPRTPHTYQLYKYFDSSDNMRGLA